jgi:L-asparaginase
MVHRPRIHLIATGGTIAGTAPDPTDTRNYAAGTLTAEELIASVPPLKDLAEISVEQLYNLDSKDMTPDHWLGLARATQAALDRQDVDGVVIIHGTDTMEESAFFLDLVLPPGKPVVFTGAMRPATALSADGPMNLYCALLVASSPEARNLGVLTVMEQRIYSASHFSKTFRSGPATFESGFGGLIGHAPPVMILGAPRIPSRPRLDLSLQQHIPRVDVVWVGSGMQSEQLIAAARSGTCGLVLALPGNCSLPTNWLPAVQQLIEMSLPLLGIPQSGYGLMKGSIGFLSHGPLSISQARVALIWALLIGAPVTSLLA